jgi:hypothetical protein
MRSICVFRWGETCYSAVHNPNCKKFDLKECDGCQKYQSLYTRRREARLRQIDEEISRLTTERDALKGELDA